MHIFLRVSAFFLFQNRDLALLGKNHMDLALPSASVLLKVQIPEGLSFSLPLPRRQSDRLRNWVAKISTKGAP